MKELTNGMKVRIFIKRIGTGDYLPSAITTRLALDGKIGEVCDKSTGHGMCYGVRVGEVLGWFDPDELTEIP